MSIKTTTFSSVRWKSDSIPQLQRNPYRKTYSCFAFQILGGASDLARRAFTLLPPRERQPTASDSLGRCLNQCKSK